MMISMTRISEPAIQVRNLSKFYPLAANLMDVIHSPHPERMHPALQGVTMEVEAGKICALMGPNASGKTTLIKILCGLILPEQGEVRIHGIDMLRHSEQGKSLVGLVSAEESGFYPRLSGRRNLEFFGALFGFSKKECRLRMEEASDLLEMDYLDQCYQEYSTGMKRWLGLARALMRNPSILILDEPTRSLDPEAVTRFYTLIRRSIGQKNNRTLFFTTHQVRDAEELADQMIILKQGRVAAQGNPAVLCATAGNSFSMEEMYLRTTESKP